MPSRPFVFKWKLVPTLTLLIVLAGCGGAEVDSGDLPPMPPTMTPIVPTATPTPVITPTPVPDGAELEPIDEGQEVAPTDKRYSITMPQYWVRGTAPPAEVAYRESGGTPVTSGYAFNVTREKLPAGIANVEEYTEFGRQAVEERFTSVETLSMEPVKVAGVQAYKWVYTATIMSDTVLVHQVYVLDADTGFLLTGSAPADGDLDAARDLFDSIAGSFSFPRG